MKILVVEDSGHLGTYLSKAIKREGHTVDVATDGAHGLWLAESFHYDVMLLDIMLPEMDGLEVLRRLRSAENPLHVLLLTARDRKEDVLTGLRTGADDYMVKPFDLDELLARVEALGRRAQFRKAPVVEVGPLTLDTASKSISVHNIKLPLPNREYSILAYLITHAGEVVSRDRLEEQIYDVNQNVMSNSVNSAISIIRKHLAAQNSAELLETRRGQGYILKK